MGQFWAEASRKTKKKDPHQITESKISQKESSARNRKEVPKVKKHPLKDLPREIILYINFRTQMKKQEQ